MAEPPEDAIDEFVSFTSTTREQAISFLKAHNNDSQKAINAYFEDPTGPKVRTTTLYNDSHAPFGPQENALRVPATAPPSRPPSRANMNELSPGVDFDSNVTTAAQSSAGEEPPMEDYWSTATDLGDKPGGAGQGLSLAEREEQELQQAVAMSLGSGKQETGVTLKSEAQFGKATRDHYDEGAWAMTLFNTSSEEVLISPDPEDRKRVDGDPAFIRPTQDNLYLGGLLTILHEIPLAREALLLRNKVLFDYGNDPNWWNGQAINLPKIVTVHDSQDDNDWDDIIYESQRLMAFLDSTNRAFGSSDALANLKHVTSYSSDSEEIVARFLEKWHDAALRADPDNPLATIFMSHAYKNSPFEVDEGGEPIEKQLYTFSPQVEPDHGQTLYDVLDTAIWSDSPGEELDDVWLETVGEVLLMKLDAPDSSKSVDVKIPSVFYPDRYLSSCREISREFRTKRLEVENDVQRLEQVVQRLTYPSSPAGTLTRREILEKAAAAVPIVLAKKIPGEDESMNYEVANEKAERLTQELKVASAKLISKLKELEERKHAAHEIMRNYSKTLTEPSPNPGEPPLHKYTLRGVCTQPHVTYVLRASETATSGDLMDIDGRNDSASQWWRISFSVEDGKARQAMKREAQGTHSASQNGDVVGYTAQKVREVEVLRAAREEYRSVLLVYANDNAVNAKVEAAPDALRGFVNKDNELFAAECEQSTTPGEDHGYSKKDAGRPQQSTSQSGHLVNVMDYENPEQTDSGTGQEMQEKGGSRLLGSPNNTVTPSVSRALDDDMEWNIDDEADHVEDARI
ncbi:hypothetical protein N7523_009187 [Penicillium sp. IBT 18751x]|nr:hypothetical protein N7523_009187 [Penicillium sp. IBT 18751x]